MRRIDTQDELFLAGEPSTSTKGTPVRYWWLNAIQEELANAVEGLGGTLDPEDNGQLFDWLLASFAMITGNASQAFMASTPAQFDASNYVATMEAVQRALGNFRGFSGLTGNTTLTAADIGKNFEVAHATIPFTVIIPLSDDGIVGGGGLYFRNNNVAPVTIQRQGTNIIHMGGATVTSIVLNAGDSIWLIKGSNGFWYCTGGSAQLRYCNDFAKSLANPGWYKLPSGIIRQFGTTASIAAGGSLAITYPLAFPVAANWPEVTPVLSGAGACYLTATSRLLTGFTINNPSPTAAEAIWSSEGY